MTENILDNLEQIKKIDSFSMLELIKALPQQIVEARDLALNLDIPLEYASVDKVVVSGMGGSAIGGDLLKSLVNLKLQIPLIINRDYFIPGFVTQDTLFISSSYSGNTEEAISSYNFARAKKAKMLAFTSNGAIAKLASESKIPCLIFPGGYPPRCAIGFSFVTLLVIFSKLKFIDDYSSGIDETIELLNNLYNNFYGPQILHTENFAKQIAVKLQNRFPIIYSAENFLSSVAVRFKGQLAENSKMLSSVNFLPEMNHNEIVGWQIKTTIMNDLIVLVLRDKSEHPQVVKRIEISKKILSEKNIEIVEVFSSGESDLARMFSLIYLADIVSFYVAILNKVDPTPVETIRFLKQQLKAKMEKDQR
jgi:glucose/mannose-6-phosphate isomerase